MKTLALLQGSPEWLAHRRTTRNASEAPAMMGASPYVTRADLIRQRATGIEREIDEATQHRFDRGHEVEPALRALAEKIVGDDLYPVTGVSHDGYLGASFDGVTLAEDVIFEAKQPNAEKFGHIDHGEIPPVDYWQIVQQFAVCESAERCLYLVGDGTEDGTAKLWIVRNDVAHDIPKLLAGWRQFDADVDAYQPEPTAAPAPVGRSPETLPALSVVATGIVEFSNVNEFRSQAMAFLGAINRDLKTDEDFANAEQTVKWCQGVEDKLDATKQQILGQMADVDTVMRTMDEVAAETRRIRLELDKLVTREKEARRSEIVSAGVEAVAAHYRLINQSLGEYALQLPASLRSDMAAAIKGKRTIISLRDAVDTMAAQHKVAASQTAERVRQCIAVLTDDAAGFEALFADRRQLVASKMPDDLRNLVKARIAEHQQREAEKLEAERERIRQEEVARLERERQQAEKIEAARQAVGDIGTAEVLRDSVAEFVATTPAPVAATARADAVSLPAGAQLKLGDINEWIAPLSIDAAGLASLGFKPSASKGAAKLYAAEDFPRVCGALSAVIAGAPARAAQKKAA